MRDDPRDDDTVYPDDDPADPTIDDMVDDALDYEAQKRLWLRGCVAVIAALPAKEHPSARVQFALDMAAIAACERAVRVLCSDVTSA